MKPMTLMVLANVLKLPALVLVSTSLLAGVDLIPQRQIFGNGSEIPVYPVSPGRVSFAHVVSYRPLRDGVEKLIDIRWAVSNWKLPANTQLSPLMTEIGRCAAFKPNSGIRTCLYMKQWWMALIVAWSCVDFMICLCGGVCSTWIDGSVYLHQWHRPAVQGLLWFTSGFFLVYSLSFEWPINFAYSLKHIIPNRVFVYFKLPPNWFIAFLACFTVATLNITELSVVRCRGKPFTVQDLERSLAQQESFARRFSRRQSGISTFGRRKSSLFSFGERRKSTTDSQAIKKTRLCMVHKNGETVKANKCEATGSVV